MVEVALLDPASTALASSIQQLGHQRLALWPNPPLPSSLAINPSTPALSALTIVGMMTRVP